MFTEEQFTDLVNKYINTVFRVALNYLKNPSDAEDVMQTVFEKLLRQTKPFESETHIRYWLIRVTVNECRYMLRSPWRKQESIDDYARMLSFESRDRATCFKLLWIYRKSIVCQSICTIMKDMIPAISLRY